MTMEIQAMNECRERVIKTLQGLRRYSPCKQWRGTGYFNVPGVVMRALVDEGLVESRKISGYAPTQWRPR